MPCFLYSWSVVDNIPSLSLSIFCDGYESTTEGHEHRRRTKNLCGELNIVGDMVHVGPRYKFLGHMNNKAHYYDSKCGRETNLFCERNTSLR